MNRNSRRFDFFKCFRRIVFALVLVLAPQPLRAKLSPEERKLLPAPAAHTVDFNKEIKPILEASCTKCHGRGRDKGGFRLDTKKDLLAGGDSGVSVLLGNSTESLLIEMVSGLDPDNVMPQKGSRLSEKQVSLLRGWIDQGLSWDATVSFAKKPPLNLTPAAPKIPRVSKKSPLQHPVDLLLRDYFRTNQTPFPASVSDPVFARRVYLDLLGLLPTPGELELFVNDRRQDKRTRRVRELLSRDQAYADHWMSFWNDLLRNDYRGTGYITGGREQITYWLFSALYKNLPYNQFVSQLIHPNEESAGFSKGIIWRGVVNASQTPEMQAAQNISQVFMGVNLKCASCHDSFINDWKLSDAYALANIYAESRLELFECDRPTGTKAGSHFIYPQLGKIDPDKPREQRLQQLALLMTHPQNGRLPRTLVNRLWQRFMGRGLVEPLDDMENIAWNPELLDWLAYDHVTNGYNIRKTIERIVTSQAYQLPATDLSKIALKNYRFKGPAIRRMTAEQFRDAVGSLTGQWHPMPAGPVPLPPRTPEIAEDFDSPTQAQWIWTEKSAASNAPTWTIYLRKEIWLDRKPSAAVVTAACDQRYTLHINGKRAGSGKSLKKPDVIDVTSLLEQGHNLIAVEASNEASGDNDQTDREAGKKKAEKTEPGPNPAGFFLHARVRFQEPGKAEAIMDFGSDRSWIWSATKFDDWEKKNFVTYAWVDAAELGPANMAPWRLGEKLAGLARSGSRYGGIRSALVAADSLAVALGRPNREQVVTSRSGVATTLQMLELNNGETLARLLENGSDKLLKNSKASAPWLIERLYLHALAREPSSSERETAAESLGNPLSKEGLQDFLWAILMLPEFQLIY